MGEARDEISVGYMILETGSLDVCRGTRDTHDIVEVVERQLVGHPCALREAIAGRRSCRDSWSSQRRHNRVSELVTLRPCIVNQDSTQHLSRLRSFPHLYTRYNGPLPLATRPNHDSRRIVKKLSSWV